jgi:hypothetical protein
MNLLEILYSHFNFFTFIFRMDRSARSFHPYSWRIKPDQVNDGWSAGPS